MWHTTSLAVSLPLVHIFVDGSRQPRSPLPVPGSHWRNVSLDLPASHGPQAAESSTATINIASDQNALGATQPLDVRMDPPLRSAGVVLSVLFSV